MAFKKSEIRNYVIAAIIILLFWKVTRLKKKVAEPVTTAPEIEDPFNIGMQWDINEYCKNVIHKPLSQSDGLITSPLLGEGWCYRGDGPFFEVKSYGDSYADEQAEKFSDMKQAQTMADQTHETVTFRLINTQVTKQEFSILDTTQDKSVVDGTTDVPTPVATSATSVGSSSFKANWIIASTATGYYIDVATDSKFTSFVTGYENLDVGNVLEKDVTGLNESTNYYFRVRAYNIVDTSVDSNTITLATTALSPPVTTAATSLTTTSFIANWGASAQATGYYLDVATDNGFTLFVPGYENLDVGNVLLRLVTGLSGTTSYFYRVRAYNTVTTSDNSNTITLTTQTTFNDWFLPSKNELIEIYTELYLNGVGGFEIGYYWSSSEYITTYSAAIRFSDGAQTNRNKNIVQNVRACRSFTAGVGAYSLRDIGPAGGLIFIVSGTTFYETAPIDQLDIEWSNIYTEIGVTAQGTAIGTGQGNTIAIIGQAGHIDSAAKLCDDLEIDN